MRSESNYSPAQLTIFRAVAGAVKNACDGHRDKWTFNKTFARSVAKRATGTLSAQWRAGLAAQTPSEPTGGARHPQSYVAAKLHRDGVRRSRRGASLGPAGGSQLGRSPLKFLQNRIGRMAGEARRAGQIEREQALVEVLRLIGAERKTR